MQVTLCKRKGGLFKKAEDLAKLCGVEVAVVIVSDHKTSEFASNDIDHILRRYSDMTEGRTLNAEERETVKLWERLEGQRRELEALTRELSNEVNSSCELMYSSIYIR